MENESLQVVADFSAWHAIISAGPVVKFTFLVLVTMSILSWMVIITKYLMFKKSIKANKNFMEKFWKAPTLDELADQKDDFKDSTLFKIFESGYKEIKRIKGSETTGSSLLSKSETLERVLRTSVENEILQTESKLSLLATTGSTAPFIGLFGTVWGILTSFQKIGAMKSASLAVVAPGISEALIATAVGLAAAIPASIAYNHFITKVKKSEHDFNSFANDLLNISERNFF